MVLKIKDKDIVDDLLKAYRAGEQKGLTIAKKDWNEPLTKEQLKKIQEQQAPSSPYPPGKSPFKKAHGPGQEDTRDKFSYRTDGVLMIDPKRDGTLRPASTDEERDYQRQRFEHEEHPYKYLKHEHSDDYGLKISPKLANIPESYKRENIGGTLRDVMLPLLIKNYGKGPDGKYQDPDKLIEMMGKLKGV